MHRLDRPLLYSGGEGYICAERVSWAFAVPIRDTLNGYRIQLSTAAVNWHLWLPIFRGARGFVREDRRRISLLGFDISHLAFDVYSTAFRARVYLKCAHSEGWVRVSSRGCGKWTRITRILPTASHVSQGARHRCPTLLPGRPAEAHARGRLGVFSFAAKRNRQQGAYPLLETPRNRHLSHVPPAPAAGANQRLRRSLHATDVPARRSGSALLRACVFRCATLATAGKGARDADAVWPQRTRCSS